MALGSVNNNRNVTGQSGAQQDVEELSRLRGLLSPEQFGKQDQRNALRGSLGTELGDIRRSGVQRLVGNVSALAGRGLGGGIQAGALAGIERSQQSALGELQGRLIDQGRVAEDEERGRQNMFSALVSGINTADLGNPDNVALLNQQLQQAIASGAVTPQEQTALSQLLSGRTNRFNPPQASGIAGLQIEPSQLGRGSFIEEFGAGITGKGGQGVGGFIGDTLSLGVPQAIKSAQKIAQGQGTPEDYLNVALLAATPFIGGGAGKLAGRAGAGLVGKSLGRGAIGAGLTGLGNLGGSLAGRSLLGSGVRSGLKPLLTN